MQDIYTLQYILPSNQAKQYDGEKITDSTGYFPGRCWEMGCKRVHAYMPSD
jgi:hypothetical protein